MPYPNEHAARLRSPDDFKEIRQLWASKGIRALGGALKANPKGAFVVQSFRFSADRWKPEKAKEWLKEHDHSPMLFEPAAGAIENRESWHQLVPLGEFPHPAGIVQVVDGAAVESMARTFDNSRKTLVDFDHYSDLTDEERGAVASAGVQLPSAAAGWVKQVEARKDGLWGLVDWTVDGAKALANKVYRFLSPVWLRRECQDAGDNKVRPLRLAKLGLTNEPNIQAIPALANRADGDRLSGPAQAVAFDLPPDTGTETAREEARNRSTQAMKEQMATILALDPAAADEAYLKAVETLANRAKEADALKNRAETSEAEQAKLAAKVAEHEAAALAAQIEGDLDEHKDVIENRDAAKAALLANREATLAAWKLLKKPAAPPDPPKREDAKVPGKEGENLANRSAELWAEYKQIKDAREQRRFYLKNREAMK